MNDRVYLDIHSIMDRIREKTQQRGAVGIRGIGRLFRIADDNGDQAIDLNYELPKLLGDIGVLLNKTEIAELSRLLDRNGDGKISYDEFLYHFAPPMSQARIDAINEVFDKIDTNKNGVLEINDLNLRHPPEERNSSRQTAKMSSNETIFQNLIKTFEKNGDGTISRQEFMDYYREMSVNIDDDNHFSLLLHNSWGV